MARLASLRSRRSSNHSRSRSRTGGDPAVEEQRVSIGQLAQRLGRDQRPAPARGRAGGAAGAGRVRAVAGLLLADQPGEVAQRLEVGDARQQHPRPVAVHARLGLLAVTRAGLGQVVEDRDQLDVVATARSRRSRPGWAAARRCPPRRGTAAGASPGVRRPASPARTPGRRSRRAVRETIGRSSLDALASPIRYSVAELVEQAIGRDLARLRRSGPRARTGRRAAASGRSPRSTCASGRPGPRTPGPRRTRRGVGRSASSGLAAISMSASSSSRIPWPWTQRTTLSMPAPLTAAVYSSGASRCSAATAQKSPPSTLRRSSSPAQASRQATSSAPSQVSAP